MKKLAFTLLFVLVGNMAHASVSADEFTRDFINQTIKLGKLKNITKINKGRTRLYAVSESQLPVKKIQSILKNNSNITVGEFANLMAEAYYCFPPFTPEGKRDTILGQSLNNTSFALNYSMVFEVLEDLNDGIVSEHTKLLDSYNNWEWLKGAQ